MYLYLNNKTIGFKPKTNGNKDCNNKQRREAIYPITQRKEKLNKKLGLLIEELFNQFVYQ